MRWLLLLLVLPLGALLGALRCGTSQNPGAGQLGSGGGARSGGGAGSGSPRVDSAPAAHSGTGREKVVGEVERVAARQRMRIWGKVESIRKGQHGELPELTTTATGGAGDPLTEIRNQTPGRLTIWFAGKCSHQVDVPAGESVTAAFCPGTYNIAAMLEDKDFLPLVREDQEFTAGVKYRLDFFVKQAPSVTKQRAR